MSRRNYGGTLKDLLVHLRPEQEKRILYQSLSFDEMVKRIDGVGKDDMMIMSVQRRRIFKRHHEERSLLNHVVRSDILPLELREKAWKAGSIF